MSQHIKSSWAHGHDIIPQSMDPIACVYWEASSFYSNVSGYFKKSRLQLPLTYLEGSSAHWGLTQLHPHLSNPNKWQLHLSKLGSTSVHPVWSIILRTSRRLHPNYAFFTCLHGHQPQNKNSSTNFAGWLSGSSVFLQSLLGIASIFGIKNVWYGVNLILKWLT